MKLKRIAALLLSLLLLSPAVMAEEAAAPILEVHQLPLGYADGYFIRCGDIDLLIDGGQPQPKSPNDDVVNTLRALGVKELDVYIITHWHLDHCMNINTVLAEFGNPETVVYSPSDELPDSIPNGNGILQIAPLANGVYRQMKIEDVVEIGGMVFTCIGPEKLGQRGKSNPDSLNFVLQYGRRKFLFTGDYAHSGMINKRFPELCDNVDVLKFPHHGGEPYVIGDIAARTTSPEYVLVPSTLNNNKIYRFFNDRGVKIPRENVLTNKSGYVVILTDGGDYFEVRTEQNPADYAPAVN